MTDTLKKVLTEYGVDMKKTMERFVGDEDIYAECLTKFLSDSSWPLFTVLLRQNCLSPQQPKVGELLRCASICFSCRNASTPAIKVSASLLTAHLP